MPDSDPDITVHVTLRSVLGKYRPDPRDRKPFDVRLPAGSTVDALLAKLGVPAHIARLVFVDHVRSDGSSVLVDGANVDVYPPVAGG